MIKNEHYYTVYDLAVSDISSSETESSTSESESELEETETDSSDHYITSASESESDSEIWTVLKSISDAYLLITYWFFEVDLTDI